MRDAVNAPVRSLHMEDTHPRWLAGHAPCCSAFYLVGCLFLSFGFSIIFILHLLFRNCWLWPNCLFTNQWYVFAVFLRTTNHCFLVYFSDKFAPFWHNRRKGPYAQVNIWLEKLEFTLSCRAYSGQPYWARFISKFVFYDLLFSSISSIKSNTNFKDQSSALR